MWRVSLVEWLRSLFTTGDSPDRDVMAPATATERAVKAPLSELQEEETESKLPGSVDEKGLRTARGG
ncbi:hypothetical protein RH831_06535 [Halodesulfurarchaeum sp. HSR-GB]|uniref:hypothetical protein n=1 Tax=Halodesulfurarchaeum sp. HSR-GB TaxID=3074077 RepID=UPI00285D8172|nr:hypothetical protein [Halodesulfurarchaeum sp. HSR-GB]MDR5656834.1 hypothetical protein [Halodesulfurarchaeum sp. HSR-GB]